MPRKKRPLTTRLSNRVRSFEGRVVLLGIVSLVLVGPLRGVLEAAPAVLFLATLVLFMVPGLLLTHWLAGEHVAGGVMVPVAFVVSVSVYGLLGVPLLLLSLSMEAYLWAAGAALVCFLAAAVLVSPERPSTREEEGGSRGPLEWLLWGSFLVFGAVLAFVSRLRTPDVYEDIWVYTAWVREFASAGNLAGYEPYFGERIEGLSRARLNGWLLEQAALSRVSGLDPVTMVLDYLTPTLVVVALFSFYALSRVLLKNEAAALFTGSLVALFFLAYLGPGIHGFGGELIGRAAEDKLVARFAFLPVVLIFAVLYLEHRRLRYLGLFALVVWAVVTVHPIGVAIIGLSVGSFGLLHVAANLRSWRAWTGTAALGTVLASVVVPPAVLLLAGGEQAAALYSADINSGDPRVLANMVFVRPEWRHILELRNGYYMMHPYLLWSPPIAIAYLVGLPFLALRLRRSLAAQMLFGIMVVVGLLVYVPPVATFFGNEIIIPGQLWRMAWPIPLAALLTVGWMAWSATSLVAARRGGARPAGWSRYAPLVLVLVLAMVVAPLAGYGTWRVYEASDPAEAAGYPADPIFGWMRENITEPAVVLAPDAENTVIPAYSASVDVISLRGGAILYNLPALEARAGEEIEVPQRVLDVQAFYSSLTFEEAFEILRRYKVDYVLVYRDTPLEGQLAQLPAFEMVETPGERYSLFAVDLSQLQAGTTASQESPTIQ